MSREKFAFSKSIAEERKEGERKGETQASRTSTLGKIYNPLTCTEHGLRTWYLIRARAHAAFNADFSNNDRGAYILHNAVAEASLR